MTLNNKSLSKLSPNSVSIPGTVRESAYVKQESSLSSNNVIIHARESAMDLVDES